MINMNLLPTHLFTLSESVALFSGSHCDLQYSLLIAICKFNVVIYIILHIVSRNCGLTGVRGLAWTSVELGFHLFSDSTLLYHSRTPL